MIENQHRELFAKPSLESERWVKTRYPERGTWAEYQISDWWDKAGRDEWVNMSNCVRLFEAHWGTMLVMAGVEASMPCGRLQSIILGPYADPPEHFIGQSEADLERKKNARMAEMFLKQALRASTRSGNAGPAASSLFDPQPKRS